MRPKTKPATAKTKKSTKHAAKAKASPSPKREPRKTGRSRVQTPEAVEISPDLRFRGLAEPDFDFVNALLARMKESKVSAVIAARNFGITELTFAQWLDHGRRDPSGRSVFAYLAAIVDAADAGAEIDLIQRIAESRDWRALTWLAERKFPERYDQVAIRLQAEKQRNPALEMPPPEEKEPDLALCGRLLTFYWDELLAGKIGLADGMGLPNRDLQAFFVDELQAQRTAGTILPQPLAAELDEILANRAAFTNPFARSRVADPEHVISADDNAR